MGDWVPIAQHFIEADVIRWREPVFRPRQRKRKAFKLGERLVVAEVLRDADGWVHLLVRDCQLLAVQTGLLPRQVPLLVKGSETKRRRKTIVGGKPERLSWSDESVRALIASKFLGRRNVDTDA